MTCIFFIILFFIFTGNIYSEEDSFIQDTLSLDIETASYYDLVIWVNKLGIESTGSSEEIRGKLYTYYDIEADGENKPAENMRSIIIESARELNYINDISIDQDYVILEGEVLLEMIDPDNNTSHKIKADKIIFNQTEKTISAYGNIEYEIIREGDNEYFHGESLVFEIETWEGIFFEGVSENSRLIKYEELGTEEEVAFFFSGDYIYRSSDDRIILNEGSISSGMREDPYYRVDADKIWVLGPGEWAIKNAVLFVGRIPVFYFPYFFLPGDELIFNPAIGYKEIDGTFINTTTYLIGLKDDEDTDTFSFLKSSNDHPVEKIRQGLFLISSKKDLDTESWWYSTGSSLKLLVDYYSRKGFFFGLDGSLHFDSFLKGFDIFTAISLSKYLYKYNENEDGIIIGPYIYTSFIKDDSGSYISVYEDSYLFGHHLPFRFAFDIDMDITNSWLRMNLDLPIYSDTKFRSHFMNREEGLKWTEFLNTEKEEVEIGEEVELTYLSWIIDGAITPSFERLSPLIEKISLDKINMKLNLQSAVMDYPEQLILDSSNYLLEDSLSFYYPSSLILPDISGTISGTIFKSSESNAVVMDEQLIIKEYELLIDPWSEEKINLPLIDTDILIDPEKLEYFPIEISSEKKIFSNRLKYSISPSFSINSIFSSGVPESPDEISFTSDYSIFSTQTTSLLDYSLNIYDSFLAVSNISNFSMNYKEHFDPFEITDVWDSYLIQDKNATNYKVTDNVVVDSKPFINNKTLSESTFTYNLSATLYNRYYDDDPAALYFIDDYFKWDKDAISTHSADMELKFYDSNNYQILKLDTILPPKDPELYPEIVLSSNHFTGSIKTGFKYIESLPEDYWEFDPYEGYIRYAFFDKDYLKQTLSIDFEETQNNFGRTELFIDKMESNITFQQNLNINLNDWEFKKLSTDLNLWFFNFNFLAEDTYGYHLDLTGWTRDETNSHFQPSNVSAGVNYSYGPDAFWKNRIRLSADINSAWTMNLLKYTDTALNFSPKLTLDIAEFLELSFESTSVNRATYLYLPGLVNDVQNPFIDLLRSFNFLNKEERIASNFNIESLSLGVIHHLSDWDLHFKYTGVLDLITVDSTKEYQWKSEFSIFIIWKPIPEIKKDISYNENEIYFK